MSETQTVEAIVEDVVYGRAGTGDVSAWLVRPTDALPGSCAGLVLWHWLDSEAPDGNRDEFLDEARSLAGRGVVSLLPQGRFPWTIQPSGSAADAVEIEAEVDRFGLGLDYVTARPEVDPARLAIGGHDFGGMLAILLAARERRVRGVAAVAPTPRWADWFLPFWSIGEDRIAYLAALRRLDPIEQVATIAPRPILLQLGRRDFYIALMAGSELRRAAGDDGQLQLEAYDAEHDMRDPAIRADRAAFFGRLLDLPEGPRPLP